MELFEVKDFKLTFSPVALALQPFKALWERDTSPDKAMAVAQLAAVYFWADFKSDFSDILDDNKRITEICVYLPELKDWNPGPDEVFMKAVEFYKERSNTVTTKLLEQSAKGIAKIGNYLESVDLMRVDDNGKPIYNAKQYSDTHKSLGDIISSHNKLSDQVKKEQAAKKDKIGSKDKNMFEDGV